MSSNCSHGRPNIDAEIQRKIQSEIDTLVRTMEHWTADAASLTITAQDFFAKAYVLLSNSSTLSGHNNSYHHHNSNYNHRSNGGHNDNDQVQILHQQNQIHHTSPARRCDMLLKLLIATGIDATIELESSGGKGRPCHRVAVLAILIAEFETFVRTRREFHADRTRRYGDFGQICEYFAIRSTCACQPILWQWSLNSNSNSNSSAGGGNNTNNPPANNLAAASAAAQNAAAAALGIDTARRG
jgi:hypothetical protein